LETKGEGILCLRGYANIDLRQHNVVHHNVSLAM